MKKIFLIYNNPSDYESYPQVIGFKTTEEEAKDIVSKLKADYQKAYSFMWNVVHPAMLEYDKANPTTHQEFEEVPRWKAGIAQKDITPEMRAERDGINSRNEQRRKDNMLAMEEHQKAERVALMPIFCSLEKEFVEKWFDFSSLYIKCRAHGLREDKEYFYEECNIL